jgi:hypothetical protein
MPRAVNERTDFVVARDGDQRRSKFCGCRHLATQETLSID